MDLQPENVLRYDFVAIDQFLTQQQHSVCEKQRDAEIKKTTVNLKSSSIICLLFERVTQLRNHKNILIVQSINKVPLRI